MGKLEEDFFTQPTLLLAELLLGKVFVHNAADGRCYKGRIVETEAYLAEGDEACHAFRGITNRNRVMYGSPGSLYVYFAYGCHYLMNIVTEPEGIAGAVLIRALEPVSGLEEMKKNRKTERALDLTNGPGKLTRAMDISLAHNGMSLAGNAVYLEEGEIFLQETICSSRRIGITKSTDLLWRRYIAGNVFVSGSKPGPPPVKKKTQLQS